MAGIRMGDPLFRPVGLSGLLVTFADEVSDEANRVALAFRDAIDQAAIPGITETSTSIVSTFVAYDPRVVTLAQLTARLTDILAHTPADSILAGHRLWRIPAVFGGVHGPQLDDAAALAGIPVPKAIDDIASRPLRVMTIGFAPGQPYLGTLSKAWDLPRQTGLTPLVPAGSLVVALRQLVLFANASPTGWRHIAQTAFRVFRPEAANPFALRPGDQVQLVPVSASDMALMQDDPDGGATSQDAA